MIIKRIKFKKMLPAKQRNAMWDTGKVLSEDEESDGSLSITCGWEDKADMIAFLVHFGMAKGVFYNQEGDLSPEEAKKCKKRD